MKVVSRELSSGQSPGKQQEGVKYGVVFAIRVQVLAGFVKEAGCIKNPV